MGDDPLPIPVDWRLEVAAKQTKSVWQGLKKHHQF
jgi:hypothetical protein